jgi:ATP-binding protein involved in chromosome partitioning
LGIVENMSYFTCHHGERYEIFGHGGGKAAAKTLNVPFLGELPILVDQREKADSGIPVCIADEHGEQAERFRAMASQLVANLAQSLTPSTSTSGNVEAVV